MLNLRLLHKKCVRKPVYLSFFLKTAAITLPEAGLGLLVYPLLQQVMHPWLAIAVAALAMLAAQALLLRVTGIYRLFIRTKTAKNLSAKGLQSV